MKRIPLIISYSLITGIAGLAYLIFVQKIGYTFDDWYLMWSAKAYGPQVFFPIFSIDRPLRAYLMFPAYLLFGENPLWYNLSAFVFRVCGTLFFLWMFRMLWPRAQAATMVMALLFVIYPGFLSQPNAIDYQSHIFALALALLSLALTAKGFVEHIAGPRRFFLLILSALVGWLYLGLMEYYIGFELIRALLIGLLAFRSQSNWPSRAKKAILDWLPLSVIPLGFVFWRVFIFVGERTATDAGAQLSLVMTSPLRAIFNWGIGLLHDIFQALVAAWFVPLLQLVGKLTLEQTIIGMFVGLAAAILTVLAYRRLMNEASSAWRFESLGLGMAAIIAGLIPVVLANRGVEFPYYSRYTLISSTGVAMVLVALILSLHQEKIRQGLLSLLVLVATFTHFANSVNAASETAAMRDFWWQVAWRAPMLEQNSTLIAQYSSAPMQEDYFVWGPANLIYYPARLYEKDIQPGLYAALPTQDTLQKVLARERQQYDKRRNIVTYTNYRNILVIVQPGPDSCVRILGPDLFDISSRDAEIFIEMAPFSEIERVQEGSGQTPPYFVFGPEPEKGWCYYYQKASLARQYDDWLLVLQLGRQAQEKNLIPADEIEWLPFLQAEAMQGNQDKLIDIGSQMKDKFARNQACLALKSMSELSPSMKNQAESIFCDEK